MTRGFTDSARAVLLSIAAAVALSAAGTAAIRLTAGEHTSAPLFPVDDPDEGHYTWGYGGEGHWFWSGGSWHGERTAEPSIELRVFDGDIGILVLRPPPADTRGLLYVGADPNEYFSDGSLPAVDPVAEARGFAAWAREHLGKHVSAAQVEPLLARRGGEAADVFAEETVERLLALVGLAPPDVPGGPFVES